MYNEIIEFNDIMFLLHEKQCFFFNKLCGHKKIILQYLNNILKPYCEKGKL